MHEHLLDMLKEALAAGGGHVLRNSTSTVCACALTQVAKQGLQPARLGVVHHSAVKCTSARTGDKL